MKLGVSLDNRTLAEVQQDISLRMVKVAMRYVREKIIIRHDPLRSPHTLFWAETRTHV